MRELDHLHVPLSGLNLIEASAGTGKTHAIVCLYLRLVAEEGLLPDQILVVTYTEAATRELRGRIRSRLREALTRFDGGPAEDPFLSSLYERNRDNEGARSNLDRALKSFDTAAIFTIHGFCLRALQDNAFESGSLYDTELLTDQEPLLQEIVDDFWRIRFFTEPAPLLAHALRKRLSPASFMALLKETAGNPKLKIVPQYGPEEIARLEERCRAAYREVREIWARSGAEVAEILKTHQGLSRSADNYRHDLLPSLLDGMVEFLQGDDLYDLFDGFDKFCAFRIEKQRLKKHDPPEHPFFDLCQDLQRNVEERFLALRWELVEYCRERLPERKREANVRFFDDLLNDLHHALSGETGGVLAGSLKAAYPAALIDEFQDTDPVQYDIFRKIYATPPGALFLIGDPKQAIYSFRGADIFAYLQAAGDVPPENRFTLTGNWRSVPRLLTAFNTLFADKRKPFLHDAIAYHRVTPGRPPEDYEDLAAPGYAAPLRVLFLSEEDGGAVSVGRANELIPATVAGEIARLLREGREGKACIGDKPVLPEDIAVIVRSHRQAALMDAALRSLGIPAVMRSDRSIFCTPEAGEVATLLAALADPGNEGKVRAALVTDILGRSGDDIARFLEDEEKWDELLQRFRDYHHSWLDRGFMAMMQALLLTEGVRGRLLRFPDGERRLTNLLHCIEILHRQAHDRGLGIEGLITWFGDRLAEGESGEEYQIRLETDDRAVRIVTVHVSKGLEYPVVFCPFLWGGVNGAGEILTFHDSYDMVKDFGSPAFDRHRILANREALAENLRLLYVALTRARYHCCLVTGKIADRTGRNRPETSALAYLLHATDAVRGSGDPVGSLRDEVAAMPAKMMAEQLRELAGRSEGTIAVAPLPEADKAALPAAAVDAAFLAPRIFTGTVRNDWRVASFTWFAAHEAAAELPDRDENREQLPGPSPDPGDASIFSFPRGAEAGIFLHEIFQELDFSACLPEAIGPLVAKGLEKHGYPPRWQEGVATMVRDVVSVSIAAPGGPFTLSHLAPGSWVQELEFFFPLRFVTPEILGASLRNHGSDCGTDLSRLSGQLRFQPVHGMVRGFIDMVFTWGGRYYLVDWKSNHLGDRREDYRPEALRREMERRLYPLQYLLYTVALNRYLSLRVRNYDYRTHFGGVLYFFLRGVSPRSGEACGIFRDLPDAGLVAELTERLIEAEASP